MISRNPRRIGSLPSIGLALTIACGGGGGGGSTSLSVEPTTLAFEAESTGPGPAAQTVHVSFSGDGLLVGYPPDIVEPTWLTVDTLSGSGSDATFAVGARAGMAPGSYRTTLRFVTGRRDGTQFVVKDVAIQYTVRSGLRVVESSLAFAGFDGVVPAVRTINVTSEALPKRWRLGVEAAGGQPSDWVLLATTAGTLTSGPAQVEVGAAARPPGDYTAQLVLRDESDAERGRIPVTYHVSPSFSLTGTLTTQVTERATLSSLDLPMVLHTQLDSGTGRDHRWEATSSAPWVSVIPASGDLAADATLTARLDPEGLWALANGTYSATVTVSTSQGGTTTATLPVTVTITLAPAISAPATASYSIGVAATSADLSRTLSVTSNLGEAFARHAGWQVVTALPWLQTTPATGAGNASLALDVVPAALAAVANGASAGDVRLQASDARVASPTIRATLTLALPDAAHLAPYLTWLGQSAPVVVRGSGFGSSGTLPVTVGEKTITASVVSDSELRFSVPAPASAGTVAVSIPNSLGVPRASTELVVVPNPGYTAYESSLPAWPNRMTLDPERQAVLLSTSGTLYRFRFDGSTWSRDSFGAPNLSGAYPTLDGKNLLVTSGNTGTPAQLFLELDPDTLVVRKSTGYPTYYERYDLVAGFNDGRTLIVDSEQWVQTAWYPDLTGGPWLDAWNPIMLLTRDRSRMLLSSPLSGEGILAYDPSRGSQKLGLAQQPFSGKDWSISAEGGRLAIGGTSTGVYDKDFFFLGAVSLPESPAQAVAVSPDGTRLYSLAKGVSSWALRRTRIDGAGPYTADSIAIPQSLGLSEVPIFMMVSEDGGTLFLVTSASSTYTFRALPLP